jgi:uncharacterized RDD family membrane protein YckC
LGPLSDLALADPGGPQRAPSAVHSKAGVGLDLPLFGESGGLDDRPLVSAPAVPRPPLAVRKSTPAFVRPMRRPRVEEAELDLDIDEEDERPAARIREPEREAGLERSVPIAATPGTGTAAPLGRRLAAGLIDVSLLSVVDLTILYFTLRLCGLELVDVSLIPPVPFLSFLLLQNGGYFVAFAVVGGQTLGKMVLGIRVVPVDAAEGGAEGVPLGAAVVRAAAWLLTVLPAGVGLLPALLSADGRAVHDRLAGTRVVRA